MKSVYEIALKRYNAIMESTGKEHLTIETQLSENTEGWNVADMVAECKAQIEFCNDAIYGADTETSYEYRLERTKFERFVKRFAPQIGNVKTIVEHV
ncbi:hypothetical protein SELR_18010 [Selenomonas ruminantium subsp. lactilytica TAM6421]|uniref:Uncharacterized protein n=1 Tax=Selenomonas ruminantium subsp. lactilytica (strain NBRC 103574 / TAM6421) TaxID=927704 RepID=I0GRX2_SELRL|nr:hypothetical protein [Selenomonas ruminantium]BAL83509.1 hypothetical protein SELR_18010 [Selenomonas ruminantium subsp. lactilytica TAM6421]